MTKTSDVILNANDPAQDALDAQKWRKTGNYGKDSDDNEDTRSSTGGGSMMWPDYSIPINAYTNNDDYKHGPVKTYTQEELAEYERLRHE